MTIKFKNKDKTQIIAIDGRKTIGYINVNYPNDLSTNRNLEIEYVYVSPNFRRSGVASSMINFLLTNFKDVTWISMWTSQSCEIDKSWGLYIKHGFEQTAYLEDYYKDGVGTRYFCKRIK